MTCPFRCRACRGGLTCKATRPRKFLDVAMLLTCDGDFEDCTLYRLRMKMDE